jgi:hypothetical protein
MPLVLVATLSRGNRALGQRAEKAVTGVTVAKALQSLTPPTLSEFDSSESSAGHRDARLVAFIQEPNRGRHALIGAVVGAVVAGGVFWAEEASRPHICNFDQGSGDCGFGLPLELALISLGGGAAGGVVGWFWPTAGSSAARKLGH